MISRKIGSGFALQAMERAVSQFVAFNRLHMHPSSVWKSTGKWVGWSSTHRIRSSDIGSAMVGVLSSRMFFSFELPNATGRFSISNCSQSRLFVLPFNIGGKFRDFVKIKFCGQKVDFRTDGTQCFGLGCQLRGIGQRFRRAAEYKSFWRSRMK